MSSVKKAWPTSSVRPKLSEFTLPFNFWYCKRFSRNIPGSGSNARGIEYWPASLESSRHPEISHSQTLLSSWSLCFFPDHNDSDSAPSFAAIYSALLKNSKRAFLASALGDISVGSCLRQGSSRKRAPVSITHASEYFFKALLRLPVFGPNPDPLDSVCNYPMLMQRQYNLIWKLFAGMIPACDNQNHLYCILIVAYINQSDDNVISKKLYLDDHDLIFFIPLTD